MLRWFVTGNQSADWQSRARRDHGQASDYSRVFASRTRVPAEVPAPRTVRRIRGCIGDVCHAGDRTVGSRSRLTKANRCRSAPRPRDYPVSAVSWGIWGAARTKVAPSIGGFGRRQP